MFDFTLIWRAFAVSYLLEANKHTLLIHYKQTRYIQNVKISPRHSAKVTTSQYTKCSASVTLVFTSATSEYATTFLKTKVMHRSPNVICKNKGKFGSKRACISKLSILYKMEYMSKLLMTNTKTLWQGN